MHSLGIRIDYIRCVWLSIIAVMCSSKITQWPAPFHRLDPAVSIDHSVEDIECYAFQTVHKLPEYKHDFSKFLEAVYIKSSTLRRPINRVDWSSESADATRQAQIDAFDQVRRTTEYWEGVTPFMNAKYPSMDENRNVESGCAPRISPWQVRSLS